MNKIRNLFARFFRYLANICDPPKKQEPLVCTKETRLTQLLSKDDLTQAEQNEVKVILGQFEGDAIVVYEPFRGPRETI